MIRGTGPGRGVPWWRQGRLVTITPVGFGPEPAGPAREGRVVTVVEPGKG